MAGVPARTATELTGVNRNTAILFFHKLREVIAERLAEEAPFLDGEVEVDESYFGSAHKGKRGRGPAGKVPVFGLLHRLLARLHRRKDELLRILDRLEIPLHTNGSENDIRACVTKRKISGGTVSDAGREAHDILLGLMKTCSKLGVSFYAYQGDRLTRAGVVPELAVLVRQNAMAGPPHNLPQLLHCGSKILISFGNLR